MKKLFSRNLYLLFLGICFSLEGMNLNMGSEGNQNSANGDSTPFLNLVGVDSSSSSSYSSSSSDFYNSSTWRWILRQDRLEHGSLTETTERNDDEEATTNANTEEPSVTAENNDDNSQENTENTNAQSNNWSYSWNDYLYLHCDPLDSSSDSDSSGLEFYDPDNPYYDPWNSSFDADNSVLDFCRPSNPPRGYTELPDIDLDDTYLEDPNGEREDGQIFYPIAEQAVSETRSSPWTISRSASYPDFLIRRNAGLE